MSLSGLDPVAMVTDMDNNNTKNFSLHPAINLSIGLYFLDKNLKCLHYEKKSCPLPTQECVGRPMGLQFCKPCSSCLQSEEESRAAGGCSCVCDDWRYCSDRCCDICCQMCVNVCSGVCSGDCSYTFCTLCLGLAQNCVSVIHNQQAETSEAQQAMMSPALQANGTCDQPQMMH